MNDCPLWIKAVFYLVVALFVVPALVLLIVVNVVGLVMVGVVKGLGFTWI